tara:strand:- start:166 stop:435 length:270 start_codon:yes stop_codon:yes gene_type:complete
MPKFKPNTSSFRMGGYSYPGISPIKKDIKLYEGSGNQITVDEKDLGEPYRDDDGNISRDHKNGDVFYLNKPRFGGPKEPKMRIPKDPIA